jgi:hypothetical protein
MNNLQVQGYKERTMESAFRNTWTRFLLVFTVLALLTGTVWAQGVAELTGVVTDPTGAVVSGATVTLTNSATGEKRTTTTTTTGSYHFPSLPVVGTYAVSVSLKGFKSKKIEGIVVSVGITASADLKLEVGAATEQVTVEASAETVQTTESSVSELVDRNIWQKMPLEVRNQNSFINLVAGAVPSLDDNGNNRGASVNGAREGAGSYLVEGSDNNEQGQAGRGQISAYDLGGANTSISPDAIQEYRVITNSFSAEYGKGGGFITDTVLKSGTNKWHGSAFEYNRIQDLAAEDFFTNLYGNKDHLVRNQFGFSAGGPIIKDKTFFYSSVEWHRVRQIQPSATVTQTTQQFLDFVNTGGLAAWAESDPGGICEVYTGAACPGQFTNYNGTGVSAATLGPNFTAIRALSGENYPLATQNLTTTANGLLTNDFSPIGALTYPVPVYGTISVPIPESQNEYRISAKVDHRFSEKDGVNVVYLNQTALFKEKYAAGNNVIGPDYIQDGRAQNASLNWNHTLTPTLLNTFKFGYLRHRQNFPGPLGAPGYDSGLGDVGVDLGLYAGLPQFFTENQFQYLDTMSVQKGKHSIKFGGEYRRTRNGSSFYNDTYGTVIYWGIEDSLTDLAFDDIAEQEAFGSNIGYGGAYAMSAAVNTTNSGIPDPYRGFRANEYAFFVQDDYKLSPRLTVNLGLRWEYFGPPHNFKNGIDSNVYFGSPVTPVPTATNNPGFPVNNSFYAGEATATFQVRDKEIWNKDTNNFGPRLGFAYDMLGNQKLVMRGGFGVMYDRIYNNTFENIRFNPPFFSDNYIYGVGPISTPGLFTYPFTPASRAMFNGGGALAPEPNPRHMDQNIVTPYYEQAHFGFQWEFKKGYVFEPEYVGTFGHKLVSLSDINTFDGRTACQAPPYTSGPCFNAGFAGGFSNQRVNPNIAADNFRSNGYGSNYHGLQLSLRKNYANGLGVTANYTYAKSLDSVSDTFNNRSGERPIDNMNHKYDYGPSDFDVKQRFVSTLSYELPFMKQNRWLGGWGANAIISRQTGRPISPYDSSKSYDLNKDGYLTDRIVPTVAAKDTIKSGNPAFGYFNTSDWVPYTCPTSVNQGLWCNAPIGRGSLIGPGFANVDFSATKSFKVTESSSFTFQANFFDLFNHPNFGVPDTNFNAPSTFGNSTSTFGDNGGHRITQLAVRFDF